MAGIIFASKIWWSGEELKRSSHTLSYTWVVYLQERNIPNKHDMFTSPNWVEADQLAISKHDRGVDLGSTEKQLQLSVVRAGLEPASTVQVG